MARKNLVHVVEAAYRLELDRTAWLRAVASAVAPILDHGLGLSLHLFRMKRDGHVEVLAHEGANMDPALLARGTAYLAASPPEQARTTHIAVGPCGSLSEVLGAETIGPGSVFAEAMAGSPVRDVLGVKAVDVDGCGVVVNVPTKELVTPDAGFKRRWGQISAHLGAAYRLRRRFAEPPEPPVEAVVEPAGRVVHAEGEARGVDAREALRAAVVNVERARTDGRLEPAEALELWRALVAGRWSLVDSFETDGRRFVVARRNEPGVSDPRGLSPRQAHVAAYASLGHDNRMIGYALGLSESTVAAHVQHALEKLGLSSRVELIRLFTAASDDAA